MQTVDFTATMPVIHPEYTHRVRDFTSTTPRKMLGIVRPVISPDGTQIAFAAVGDIYVMPASGGARDEPHEGRGARHRSVVVARRRIARLFVGQEQPAPAALDPRHEERRQPQGHQHHHAAAGRVVLARRQAHRVLQRRRHVAGGRDVDPRPRLGPHHQDPRLAAAAGHADVVARRQAHRARRHRADDRALPRRHQPGADDLGGRRRREVVRADPAAVDRFARRRRAGVVARTA